MEHSKSIKQLIIILFSFSLILIFLFIFVEETFFGDSAKKVALENAVERTKEREYVLNEFMTRSKNTLYFIRKIDAFKNYIEDNSKAKLLENSFLSIVESQVNFMQLRFIDKNGIERIRIDKDSKDSSPYIIPKDKLQDKSDRYYFTESKTRELEKVWFTKMELNVENGVIEIPYKPTLRAIIPIKHNNEFNGILVVNYLIMDFIKEFTYTPLYDMIIYDNKGFTIYHYTHNNKDHSKCWGFYSEPKYDISQEFPDHYKDILSNELLTTENFVSRKLDISIDDGLNLILKLKKSYLQKEYYNKISEYMIVVIIVLILSVILSFLVAKLFSEKLSNIKKLKELSSQYESEKKKFEYILHNATDGLHILDLDGNIVEISKSFAKNLAYTFEEASKLNLREWNKTYKKDEIEDIIKERIKKSNTYETKHRRKDGTFIDVQITSKGIEIDGKKYLYASQRDITAQKEFESKLQKAHDNLKRLLDLQDNIVIVSNGREISFANHKFFEFLGYKDLLDFKKYHKGISEKFIGNDRFFHTGKIEKNMNWIEEIQKLPQDEQIVSLLSRSFEPHAFSVSVNQIEEDMTIVSFSDISQTILGYIELEEKNIHDKLTGAYNREFFEQNIKKLIHNYNTSNSSLAIAFIDIDHFKLVNDTYGHDIGDEVLKEFVQRIKKFTRNDDVFIRWGGEEFLLVLKVKSKEDLKKALEHLRRVIQMQDFKVVGQKTCSIGGTIYKESESIETTIKRADEGVYDAKAAGRNLVIVI